MAKKNKSDEKFEEANFEVSSLDEVKDENGNGIFHMQTRTKIIAAISVIILAVSIILIYLTVEKYFDAHMWQVIVWGICGILSLYAIFARSVATLLLNVILFSVLSFFPFWQSGYEVFKPVIEKFSTSEEKIQTENKSVEEKPVEEKSVEEKSVEEKPVKEKPAEEKSVEEKSVEEKPVEEKSVDEKPVKEKSVEEKPVEEKSVEEKIPEPALPRI